MNINGNNVDINEPGAIVINKSDSNADTCCLARETLHHSIVYK